MGLTFYYVPNSTASVTRMVLAELDIPHEVKTLSIAAGDTRSPEFLAINPNGRVPVVVHADAVIWESCAITMYLGETFGVERGLYPPLGPSRGLAMRWIAWASVTLAEAAGRVSLSSPGTAGGVETGSRDYDPDSNASAGLERARHDLEHCLEILEAHLANAPYLVDEYSLADTHVHAFVGWVTTMNIPLEGRPSLLAWLQRCSQRPALLRLDP